MRIEFPGPKRCAQRRTDIQGLRAISALLIAIYHIWIGRVSGGVDIFFVVSGYLLIGSLARQLETTGRIDLFAFATRLAHRLLPASIFVAAVILVTGWIWLPQIRWGETIDQLAASTLYFENWFLAFNSVDYLARDELGTPVQHYWAMSAQVQSLLIVALTLTVFGRVMAVAHKAVTGTSVLILLFVLFVLSLANSIHATALNQPFAYFDPFTRIWEFAVGGVVAILLSQFRLSALQRTLGGWLGLVGVLACGVVLDVSSVFPGYAALWPVTAAAAILVCGQGAGLRHGVNRLLESGPLVWLGDISYALYLWHWPVLVFYLTLTYQTRASVLGGSAVLLVSILLAYLTTYMVESRFRESRNNIVPLRTALGSILAIAVMGIGLVSWKLYRYALIQVELGIALNASSDQYPGVMALRSTGFDAGVEPVYPGPLTARSDRSEHYRDHCHQTMAAAELLSCTYGPHDSINSIALVGGSHSAQWFPALRRALADMQDWRIVTYTKAGCPFSTEQILKVPEQRRSCKDWNTQVLRRLLTEKPNFVFTTATRTTFPRPVPGEHVPQGYRSQWSPLLDVGIRVVAVRDTPRFGFDVPECVDIKGRGGSQCTLQRQRLLTETNPALALAEADSLDLIDLSDSFCTHSTCPPVIGNILVYRDWGHITPAYMRTLAAPLAIKLKPILARAGNVY